MIKHGSQVKYGYLLKDDITMNDYIKSFYKAIHLSERIDIDNSIDKDNRYFLRIEIPSDMKTIWHIDGEHDHRVYMVLNNNYKQVKDLNPSIVYKVDRGFRVNKKLTQFYINNPDYNVSMIFNNKVKLKGKGRRRI